MSTSYRNNRATVALAQQCRRLRRDWTDAELRLWSHLRGRQVVGAKFRRQHQFGRYILDFFCPEHRLVVEADGGQHTDPEVAARDAARTRFLEARGLRVLRFSNIDILKNTEGVLLAIARAIEESAPDGRPPSP